VRSIALRLRRLARPATASAGLDGDAVAGVHRRLGRDADTVLSAAVRDRLKNATSNAERFVLLQEDAQRHIADGTLVMGAHSYAAPTIHKFKGDEGRVVIGPWASVAPDSDFYVGGIHPIHWVSLYGIREMFDLPGAYGPEMPMSKGDIHVGSDTWVTNKTTVLSGVTIGHGAVVGTQAVVTKDIAPYAIVAGNPARQIGQRFDDDTVAALLRIAWWDWDVDTVVARAEELNGGSIEAFVERHDPAGGR